MKNRLRFLFVALVTMVLFQNCGPQLNLSQEEFATNLNTDFQGKTASADETANTFLQESFEETESQRAGDNILHHVARTGQILRYNNLSSLPRSHYCVHAGDRVELRKGTFLRGRLHLRYCDSSPGSFTLTAYGSGQGFAGIVASERASGLRLQWQKVDRVNYKGKEVVHLRNKKIYRLGPLQKPVKQLWLNNLRSQVAVHPNVINGSPTFFSLTSDAADCSTDKTCLSSTAASSTLSLIGQHNAQSSVEAVVRVTDWHYDVAGIEALNANTGHMQLQKSLRHPVGGGQLPRVGFGFYLRGSPLLLDTAGEWAMNADDKYIYYLAKAGEVPSASQTELVFEEPNTLAASAISIDLATIGSVRINDIRTYYAPGNGFRIWNGRSAVISNSKVYGVEETGIIFHQVADVTVQGSGVVSSAGSGILIGGRTQRARVLNNREILNNGLMANQNSFLLAMNGIHIAPAQAEVKGNRIDRVGFAGITTSSGSHTIDISNNQISNYCRVLNDCGGIYINGNTGVRTSQQYIMNNSVQKGIGFTAGTPPQKSPSAKAIYLDVAASGFFINGNTISEARSVNGAIFVHAGNQNTIRDNTVAAEFGPAIGVMRNSTACDANGNLRPMDRNVLSLNRLSARNSSKGLVYLANFRLGRPLEISRLINNEFCVNNPQSCIEGTPPAGAVFTEARQAPQPCPSRSSTTEARALAL